MSTGSHPVSIYSGKYTEVIFLKSLLEASGIEASLVNLSGREALGKRSRSTF